MASIGRKKGSIPWNKGKKGVQVSWKKGLKGFKKSPNAHKFPKGVENPRWAGGRSRGYKTGYYSLEYKIWRISVFERDSYRCQGCGAVGIYLTAHHIKSFAHFPELRFTISNGVTLCEDCHKLTDNYRGRGRLKKQKI